MLVLIGAKENHGPFGQKFSGSAPTVALRPEPGVKSAQVLPRGGPDSDLYAESSDADIVMGCITAHA